MVYLWKSVDWRCSGFEAAPVLLPGEKESGPSSSPFTQATGPGKKNPGFLCDVDGYLVSVMASSTKEMLVILPVLGNLWRAPMVLWTPAPGQGVPATQPGMGNGLLCVQQLSWCCWHWDGKWELLLSAKSRRGKESHWCLDNQVAAACLECNSTEEGKLWGLFHFLCGSSRDLLKHCLSTIPFWQHRLLSPIPVPLEDLIIISNLACLENELKTVPATTFVPRSSKCF